MAADALLTDAPSPWHRFLLEVAYDGSKYHGAIASMAEHRSVTNALQASDNANTHKCGCQHTHI